LGGLALLRAFPGQVRVILLLLTLVFFWPPLAATTHLFAHDGAWQSLIGFWVAVLLWQTAATARRWRWPALLLAAVCLGAALLIYESPILLFPVGELLAAVVLARHHPPRREQWAAAAAWAASVALAYAIYWLVRERYGIDLHSSFRGLPPLSAWLSYPLVLAQYAVTVPPTLAQATLPDVAISLLTGAAVLALLWRLPDAQGTAAGRQRGLLALTGLLLFGAGIAPYLLTGYVPVLAYSPLARIYSAAIFGAALLVALLLPRRGRAGRLALAGMALWVSVMSLFPLTGRDDLQALAGLRRQWFADLIQQVPAVPPHTTFLLVDVLLQRGQAQTLAGSTRFIQILYDPTAAAWPVLAADSGRAPMIVGRAGLRQIATAPPVPLNSLLILRRQGDRLVLVDCLTPADALAILWQDGLDRICTQPDRILPDPAGAQAARLRAAGIIPGT
jgi:hypothetical protein